MPLPWERHPALCRERLSALATLIRDVQNKAARRVEKDEGDGPWCTSCVAYERTIRHMAWADLSGDWSDWFHADVCNLECTMYVGGIPLKLYSGTPTGTAPDRHAEADPPELQALQLAFSLTDQLPPNNVVFRLAVVHKDMDVSEVWYVELDEYGKAYNEWRIPFDEGPALQLRRKPVDVGQPVIGGLRGAVEKDKKKKEG